MNDNVEERAKSSVRSRGRMMDFAPRNAISSPRPVKRNITVADDEQRRREIARREVARREEIHRQIERQKEEDIIAKRRAIAARKDLARRLEAEREENREALAAREKELELQREREERAKRRAMIEARAMRERQRIIAERRAKRARAELEARRKAENMLRPGPIRDIKNPRGSKDPLARQIVPEEPKAEPVAKEAVREERRTVFGRKNKVENRLGSVEDFERDLDELEHSEEKTTEIDFDDFAEDRKADDYFDDIDEIEKSVEAEEDTSRNNDRFVLGGRSPFINTAVEKRPLSGGNRTFESTAAVAAKDARPRNQKASKVRGRYVPYEEPIPHKNIYARTVEKEKSTRDVPTMVVGEAPKGSKISLIIAIILTIVLGAAVGAIAYLALFQ